MAGIIGGGVGGQLLTTLLGVGAGTGGNMDLGSILAQVAGGGVGGGIVMLLVGIIRQALGGQSTSS